jgi:hypothetical protein
MAKHFRAMFDSYCVYCKKKIVRGDMMVKIKDERNSIRKRHIIEQCGGQREAWIHKMCYRAIVAALPSHTQTNQQTGSDLSD